MLDTYIDETILDSQQSKKLHVIYVSDLSFVIF